VVVFSNGFEEGDFSAWTGTGNTPTIVESPTHHGMYAMEVNANNEYARIAIADLNTLYFNCYFRLNTVPAGGEYINLLDITSNAWQPVSYIQIIYNAIGYGYQNPGGAGGGWHPVSWNTGQWYNVEMKQHRDDAEGEYRLYFEGAEVITATELDTSGIPEGFFCMFGDHSLGGVAYTLQLDCINIDTAYVGLESNLVPRMMNHYRRINKIIRG